MKIMSRYIFSLGAAAFTVIGLLLSAPYAIAATQTKVPTGTAIPVRFVRSVDAKRARSGDRVIAKTLQIVFLPQANAFRKGLCSLVTLWTHSLITSIPNPMHTRRLRPSPFTSI